MKLQTVRKLVTIGFTLSIIACFIGIFGGSGNPELSNYMLTAAVLFLLFTIAILMKWARCPWCGGSLIKGFYKNTVCRHCHRDLETGKKKKGKGGRK